jgi:ankyrin repeat protein
MLLGAGSAVDARTAPRETALHCAAQNVHSDVVRLLLGAGAAVDAASAGDETAVSPRLRWQSRKAATRSPSC